LPTGDNQAEEYLAMESEAEANLTDGEDEEISKVFTESADDNLKFERNATIEEEEGEENENEEIEREEEEEEEEEEYEEVTDNEEENDNEEQETTENINGNEATNSDNVGDETVDKETEVTTDKSEDDTKREQPNETKTIETNGDSSTAENMLETQSDDNISSTENVQQQVHEDNASETNSQHPSRTTSSRRVRFRVESTDVNSTSGKQERHPVASRSEQDAIAAQLADSSGSTLASLENGSSETDYDGEHWENGDDEDEKSSDEAYSTEENDAINAGAAGQSSTSRLSSARRVRSATNSAAKHQGQGRSGHSDGLLSEESGM
jgi:hypothetical protein